MVSHNLQFEIAVVCGSLVCEIALHSLSTISPAVHFHSILCVGDPTEKRQLNLSPAIANFQNAINKFNLKTEEKGDTWTVQVYCCSSYTRGRKTAIATASYSKKKSYFSHTQVRPIRSKDLPDSLFTLGTSILLLIFSFFWEIAVGPFL